VDIGLVGGTGPAGKALAARLSSVGLSVAIGSRSEERAAGIVEEIRRRWPDHGLDLVGVGNEAAAAADLVIIATPWGSSVETTLALAERLADKVVVSMVNALEHMGSGIEALVPARGSMAVAIQQAAPAAAVAGAFHHLPARKVADLSSALDADVLVCSDVKRASETTIELAGRMPGVRGLDAGSLAAAGAIEAFTAVMIGVNVRYRAHTGLRLTGIGDGRPPAPVVTPSGEAARRP
jgi:8-hydroxy-5-deazaflavin:NADPH oxidoreductase